MNKPVVVRLSSPAIHSMAGQVYSAAATMLLINEYKVDIVINYGVVGSLVKEVKTYDKCIVGKVVHYNFDTSEVDDCEIGRHFEYEDIYIPTSECLIKIALEINSDLKVVVCASGDKFITKKDEKQELAKNFKADICDMETAGIVMIANRANVPCIIIKTVSDSIVGGAKEFKDTFNECAILAFEIANKLINKLKEEV